MTDGLESNYAISAWCAVSDLRMIAEAKMADLNRKAGGDFSKAQELTLYVQGQERLNDELLAPLVDTLTDELIALRHRTGIDKPPVQPPPAPTPRALRVDQAGDGRIERIAATTTPDIRSQPTEEIDPSIYDWDQPGDEPDQSDSDPTDIRP